MLPLIKIHIVSHAGLSIRLENDGSCMSGEVIGRVKKKNNYSRTLAVTRWPHKKKENIENSVMVDYVSATSKAFQQFTHYFHSEVLNFN